jgi:RNA polymerase sigma-70 factor (ECF subfamily)
MLLTDIQFLFRHGDSRRMCKTSITLLERLRQPGSKHWEEGWARFVDLYTPLLVSWARRWAPVGCDPRDLVQELFTVLVRELPRFQYNSGQRFRGWLFIVARNCCSDCLQRLRREPAGSDGALERVTEPDNVEEFREAEYRSYLVSRALALMQADFQPTTWKACWETVVEGRPPEEVAGELGITVNAVYVAKARVLRRLRLELEGLMD